MKLAEFPEVVNFKKLFRERGTDKHPYPRTISYKGREVFFSDKVPVGNEETLIFSIESTNSHYPQGFCIGVYDGYLKVDDNPLPKSKRSNILFWEFSDAYDSKHIEIQIFTEKGYIFIKNIWEINLYEEKRLDITGQPKTVQFPEGKPIACFANGDQWRMGRGNGAAMYSEDISRGKRYFCNDGDEDDDFDDIIFTLKRSD